MYKSKRLLRFLLYTSPKVRATFFNMESGTEGEVMIHEVIISAIEGQKAVIHNTLKSDMFRFTKVHLGPRISPSKGQMVRFNNKSYY